MNNQRSQEPLRGKKFIFIMGLGILVLCIIIVSAVRLPTVGGDTDAWGTILNNFLNTSHNESGELRPNNLSVTQKITFSFNEVIDNIIDGWITITGNLNVTENITANYFIGDGSGLTGVIASNTAWNRSGTDVYLAVTGDNVGIGTTSPTEKLMVNGSLRIQNTSGTLALYVNESTGNVGIGTSSPGAKLDVVGDLNVKGSARVTGTGNVNLHIRPDSGNPGYIYWAENAVAERGILGFQAGSSTLEYRPAVASFASGTTALAIQSGGNVGIGTTSPTEKLMVNGSLRIQNSSGTLALYVNESTGNVGIGTTTPDEKLVVEGNVRINSTSNLLLGTDTYKVGRIGSFFDTPDTGTKYDAPGIAGGWYGVHDFYTGYNGGASTLAMRIKNGKVGIGTDSPAAKLDSVGTIRSTAQTVPASGEGLEMLYDSGIGYLVSYNRTGSAFLPLQLSGSKVTINGNVGIGTTSPGENLVVQGIIQNETEDVMLRLQRPISSALYYPGSVDFVVKAWGAGGSPYDPKTQLDIRLRSTESDAYIADVNVMTLLNTGNVGIGTTSPTETLMVNGSLRVQNSSGTLALYVNESTGNVGIGTTTPKDDLQVKELTTIFQVGSGITGTSQFGRNIYYDSGFKRIVADNDASVFNIDASGNFGFWGNSDGNTAADSGVTLETVYMFIQHGTGMVGIGTTTPQQELNVVGDTNLSGTLYAGNSNLFVNTSSVGIGTASPSRELEIVGNSNFPLMLDNTDSGTTGIAFQSNNVNKWLIGSDLAHDGSHKFSIYDWANSSSRLLIDGAGNVGIGTSTPKGELDIGEANPTQDIDDATTTTVLIGGENVGRLYIEGGTQADLILDDRSAAEDEKVMQLINEGGTTRFRGIADAGGLAVDNILVIDNTNGNIGIGTGTPQQKLNVIGTVNATSFIGDGSQLTNLTISSDAFYRTYDTGWVNTNDWTNQHLGTTVGGNVTHALGAPLSNLTVKVLISSDGTDANSFEISDTGFDAAVASLIQVGISIAQVDSNNIRVQTGVDGIIVIANPGGTVATIDTEDWYYKIVVSQIIRLNTSAIMGGVPANTISPFYLESCPVGWILADGSSGTPDLRGIFIRGAGTSGVLQDANGNYFTGTYGAYENDMFQGHYHGTQYYYVTGGSDTRHTHTATATAALITDTAGNTDKAIGALTDPAHGTVRHGDETAPANIALIYCMKTTEDSATSNTIWATSGDDVMLNNASKNLNIQSNLTVGSINVTGDASISHEIVSGEPSIGTLHLFPDISTASVSSDPTTSWTTVDWSAYVPAGTKAVYIAWQIKSFDSISIVWVRGYGQAVEDTRARLPFHTEVLDDYHFGGHRILTAADGKWQYREESASYEASSFAANLLGYYI